MGLESNWKNKTLENLEKDFWPRRDFESSLVESCYALRKKPLNQFEIEDLRLMISQNIGLKYLVPIAIEHLERNILIEGDYYEGDLLKAASSVDAIYWKNYPHILIKLTELIQENRLIIIEEMGEKEFGKLLNY